MFKKVLIANRGEIACRIIRACHAMNIRAVAIYSEADANALHVQLADEAFLVGPSAVSQSYLQGAKIVEIAKSCNADAVHPGYGLLSENADFAELCQRAGLVFIGPKPAAIARMGSKVQARQVAIAAGVPVVPGSQGAVQDEEQAVQLASEMGYPVMLKASAGGGGIGMVVAHNEADLRSSFASSSKRVLSYFGDGTMYLEKFIERPRHVEIQVLADEHGNAIHLGERECSIQRRHQKIVEESPSTAVTPELREQMGRAALALVRELQYTGVGTVEFLLDTSGKFYFLEMNTRLQVEHPVTEEVMGVDLVQWQLRVAMGQALDAEVMERRQTGHAIECRICAEDPERFFPSPGTITELQLPEGPSVRNEIGVRQGDAITPYYDPMFAKLITYGKDREEARQAMLVALRQYHVAGIKTNLPLLQRVLENEAFAAGDTHTSFLHEQFGL
ncbi:acetyl-CoA carboxylase biotin carboxylase subunit [Sulfoacidibacillus thermotolerans]|uniref:biotin carboxylase n=1 Tax=Sulfoacidibacillus thermotolerans TaxID=1765684 RepID=A0A2U3D8W0_SULT2|nr:acetyl-CoA carboxylase biotin carboxylase subunit [Sulfoacidibacillus thermotolerans]PWI57720.1 biotin carboxylase [Sulfoacidibacillus thermotolerans]